LPMSHAQAVKAGKKAAATRKRNAKKFKVPKKKSNPKAWERTTANNLLRSKDYAAMMRWKKRIKIRRPLTKNEMREWHNAFGKQLYKK